jgi:hypothetical protein
VYARASVAALVAIGMGASFYFYGAAKWHFFASFMHEVR